MVIAAARWRCELACTAHLLVCVCVSVESRDRGGGCVSQAPLQHAAAWEVARAPVRVTTAKKPV